MIRLFRRLNRNFNDLINYIFTRESNELQDNTFKRVEKIHNAEDERNIKKELITFRLIKTMFDSTIRKMELAVIDNTIFHKRAQAVVYQYCYHNMMLLGGFTFPLTGFRVTHDPHT